MDVRVRIRGLLIALLGVLVLTPYFFGRAIQTKFYIMGFGVYCVVRGLRLLFFKKPQQPCCDHRTCGCDRGRVAYPR
jgi:hypothetical protein